MSNVDLLLSPTGKSNLLANQSDSTAAVRKSENKSDVKETKNVNEDVERTGKKRDSFIRRKNMDRINRIHLRRSGGSSHKSPAKTPKQEEAQTRYSASANQSQEEIVGASKPKNAKKNPEEVISTSRFKRKSKDLEKLPDSKANPSVEKAKKSGSKTKAVTAFGTTFHKVESDQPPLPKKRASSSTDRFRQSKRSKSKDAITEEAGDEPANASSQSQLRPSTGHSGLKMSLSKNKLTEMLEENDLERDKIRGAFESATEKRARSPYHASSKVENKKQSSKLGMEGDPRNTNGKQDEKSEIGKDLSFFEKIQQNVRAYFSPKLSEITKFEEEEKKKVQEGEHPVNDENIMIWKDERIKRGFKEDSMKGDQSFFKCIENERKSDLDKVSKAIENEYFPGQKSARGNGSGPGGKIVYSNGDIYKPNTDYQFKRFYYIKRRNCTEKPRTGSFHRSKAFQKNGLAPSAPNSSSSIGLILEPDEQVENISSSNGVASAFIQIQELHQEVNPNVIERRVNYARGTRKVIVQEDNLTPRVDYTPGEITVEWMRGCRKQTRRNCRLRLTGSRRKRTAAAAKPKSTTCLRGYDSGIKNRTKSEGSIQSCSSIHSIVHQKEFPRQTLPNEKVKPTKKETSFVPVRRQWFVYSVTDTKQIQTTRQKLPSAESDVKNAQQSGIKSGCKKAEDPEAAKKVEEEPTSVTLKDIISLLRTVLHQSSEKVQENSRDSSRVFRKSADNSFAMSHCLEKLMEEKKNYLNLEKTKKLRKAQKANFASDSFNFFNLLNNEFLSLKSSNPKIEELRNVIAQKKEPEMEEYLDMYRKVIKMSLTEPEQYLMVKAKQKLERYTDMYYDLMKFICQEKEGKHGASIPSEKSSEKRRDKINYGEVLKRKVGKSGTTRDNSSEKAKTRVEKSHCLAKTQDRANRDSDTGKSCYKGNNVKKNGGVVSLHAKDHNVNDSKTKPVAELNPQKSKEPQLESELVKNPDGEKEDPSSKVKSSRDDRLFIQSTPEDGSKGVSDSENKGKTSLTPEGDDHESGEAFTQSSKLKKSQFAHERTDSALSFYSNSSLYENDSIENQSEQSMLKFKASRNILRDGLQIMTLFSDDESEDERRQRCNGEVKNMSLHKNFKTLENDKKREVDNSKQSRKRKCGTDSSARSTREENIKENFRKKRSSSFARSESPNEKEFTTKKVPWWRKDSSPPSNTAASRRKSYQAKKTEIYKSPKRTSPKAKKETGSREDKKKRKIEVKAKTKEESPKSDCGFFTPPGTYFEWRFGLKDLEKLLQEMISTMPNTDGLSESKPLCPDEEKEETELMKSNFSGTDENGDGASEKQEPSVCIGHKTSLRLGFHNPLKAEWMEGSSVMDHQRAAEVLNQFLGSVAEVWRATACLRNLIQPQTSKVEDLQPPPAVEPKEGTGDQVPNSYTAIGSFKNFLRILTTILEDDPRSEAVRKELSLLKKEFIGHSCDPTCSAPQCETGARTRFVQEIAEIPRELREMIANELISNEGETEDAEPAFFLAVVKKIGEKLKDSYLGDECESSVGVEDNDCCQPQKIYYRPPKNLPQEDKEESVIKSNMGNLAEKIRKLCKEKNIQESTNEKLSIKNNARLDRRSSIYFDAADTILHSDDTTRCTELRDAGNIDKARLSPIDESYFSLNASNFEKYRGLIYDKIINFLRSDNPSSTNYGIALLGRMIDRDGSAPVKIEMKDTEVKDEGERRWQDLLDKLMEVCKVIETEMKKEVEKCAGVEHEHSGKKEIIRTCEYLKDHVNRMNTLIKEMKSPDGQFQPDDPVKRIKALENSRETNKERQLISHGIKFPEKQKYFLDSAMDFINSVGNIGYSFEKFPFFPKCFVRSGSENKLRPEIDTFRNEVSNELFLEGNKTMVKSLRKNIEKRQRKIQGMIEEAAKGVNQDERLIGEKITRKVKDLKKYYLLLEKMICDPTLLPPRWLKLSGSEEESGRNGKSKRKKESSLMTMLEDIMKQVSIEHKTFKSSKSTVSAHSQNVGFRSPASVGSLKLVKIKYETLNVKCPVQSKEYVKKDVEEVQNGVPLRPITA